MKIGMALSGGGARGIAHLGILKVLEELNIKPAILTGTSAGAIVGAFYAYGYSPDDILKIILNTKILRIMRPAFTFQGLLTLEKTSDFFKEFLPEDNFNALKIPLYICVTNVVNGKTAFISAGRLIRALIASSAIPVLFNPVEIDGEKFIDGGVLNNLAVEPLIGHCDKIIGLHCNPIDEEYKPDNMRDLLERTFILTINNTVFAKKSSCDVFLEPYNLRTIRAFDFARAKEIFNIGYEYAKKEKNYILDSLRLS